MAPAREANWIDGLRGVASVVVVLGHLCTSFIPEVHAPANSPEDPPTLLQLPFLRLCMAGRTAVTIFFMIIGYGNALSTLAKFRTGNLDGAYSALSRSAFARAARLILPVTVATLVSWILANTSAYFMITHVDATWIRQGWIGPSSSLMAAFKDLIYNIGTTWTEGWNWYDGTQWTMMYLLEASMLVYMILLATAQVNLTARKAVYVVVFIYAWVSGRDKCYEALKTMNVAVGLYLAEMHLDYDRDATSVLPTPIPVLMIIVGLFIGSYPQDSPGNAGWSRAMEVMLLPFVPEGADLRRYWDTIGCTLLILGIFFSANARRLLSTPVCNFLGRVSFPVYLLHNSLIKTVLTWMIYFPSYLNPKYNEKGEKMDLERGSTMHVVLATGVFFAILFRLSHLWTLYIDPVCERLVRLLLAFGARSAAPLPVHTIKSLA